MFIPMQLIVHRVSLYKIIYYLDIISFSANSSFVDSHAVVMAAL